MRGADKGGADMRQHYYPFMRRPKTLNEKKANQEGWERAARKPRNLADEWDDEFPEIQRSWKERRRYRWK